MNSARVDTANLHDYLTSEVALEETEIARIDLSIPIVKHCTDEELNFGMPDGSGNLEDDGNESNAMPTASWRLRAETEHETFDQGTSEVAGYDDEDGVDADADEQDESSHANNGSTQTVDD
jgi:hypothetical protein